MNKLKKYIAFFAATLNIVASVLFFDGIIKKFTEPDNVSSSIAIVLALLSIILWVAYVILYFILSKSKNK